MTARMSRADQALAMKLIETRTALWEVINVLAAREGLVTLTDPQVERVFEHLRQFCDRLAEEAEILHGDCPHCGS